MQKHWVSTSILVYPPVSWEMRRCEEMWWFHRLKTRRTTGKLQGKQLETPRPSTTRNHPFRPPGLQSGVVALDLLTKPLRVERFEKRLLQTDCLFFSIFWGSNFCSFKNVKNWYVFFSDCFFAHAGIFLGPWFVLMEWTWEVGHSENLLNPFQTIQFWGSWSYKHPMFSIFPIQWGAQELHIEFPRHMKVEASSKKHIVQNNRFMRVLAWTCHCW